MILELDEVTRRFGDVTAVDQLSLTLESGEFLTLLGPSGCGKTTALRIVAGFEPVDEGRVRFEGLDITGRTPQRRGFGMVFQNYALFPHLNVFENVAFGLKTRREPKADLAAKVGAALERVALAGYEKRAVQALSGGQQQRVALARALAVEPPLLLLDEPLSNLDQALRVRTRGELRKLVKELGITALFVTHDQEEAFDLSDRIAVMNAGRIRQIGTPRALYEEPADRFVASFVGTANVIPVEVEGDPGSGGFAARFPEGAVWPAPSAGRDVREGPGVLLVRPEDLRFDDGAEGTPLSGVVRDRRFRGAFTVYRVEGTGFEVQVASPGPGPATGDRVRIRPRGGALLHLFPREGSQVALPTARPRVETPSWEVAPRDAS